MSTPADTQFCELVLARLDAPNAESFHGIAEDAATAIRMLMANEAERYRRNIALVDKLSAETNRADSEAQRAEAYKLRIATLDESIAGCAKKVQAVAGERNAALLRLSTLEKVSLDFHRRASAAESERDALKLALEVIAKQALAADMPLIGVDPAEADYEAGYIGCVETARNALAVETQNPIYAIDLASGPDRTVYHCLRCGWTGEGTEGCGTHGCNPRPSE